MEIEIEKLREITNLIFDHLHDDVGVHKIKLDNDFYWDIDSEKLYNIESKPDEIDIGRLNDDWEFLLKINSKEEAVSLMLIHIAPLLKYIGTKVGQ